MRTSLAVVVALVLAGCGSKAPGRLPVEEPAALAPPAPPVITPEAAPDDPPPPALRLPGDVRPTRGELELTIFPEREWLDGVARFAVEVVRPTAVVWLNATGLERADRCIADLDRELPALRAFLARY